jgi:glycosyltransferase involved in cell wall biosynthesis
MVIDDSSKDNSKKAIKSYLKEDKRIFLIKNKKNKGTFISRNLGVLFSKGQYIIIPDPDDIISRNILKICYKYAEKYNYEIIRFNTYKGNNIVNFNYTIIIKKLIFQPELSTYIFNENDKLEIIDFWVTNKFIKKETYIRALNILNNNFLNLYIKNAEDVMMNFILHRIAKSLYKINNLGYYHIKNSQSLSNTLFPITKLKIKFSFLLLKLIFDYSKNTKNEKDISLNFYPIIKFLNIQNKISIIKKDFIFYKNFINTFIKCKFISMENKRILESFKNLINGKDFK